MTDTYLRDGRTWASASKHGKTHLVLEPVDDSPWSRGVVLSVYVDGDGPGVVLDTAQVREVAAELGAHADVIDALSVAADVAETRRNLRHLGHAVTDSLDRDVDRAIDLERQRKEDDLARVAVALGADPDDALTLRLDDIVARAAGIAARAGDTPWRTGACTCRDGGWLRGQSSVVNPECPEHSPGTRFGGRPATPRAITAGDERSTVDMPRCPTCTSAALPRLLPLDPDAVGGVPCRDPFHDRVERPAEVAW